MNVGPRADGAMPQPYWDGTSQLAAWMAHSADSLFGTSAGAWPDVCDLPVTVKGARWYVHVPPSFKAETVVVKVARKPLGARVLRTGDALPVAYSDGVAHIELRAAARTELVDVLELRVSA